MKASVPHVAAAERMRQLPKELTSYAGFGEAVAALASGRPASLDGVWGSACALVAAGLACEAAGPLLVICPTQRTADELAADLDLFTAAKPILYPAWESEPDDRLVHDETFGDRLRVLKGLMQGSQLRVQGSEGQGSEVRGTRTLNPEPCTLLVTSIQALLQPSPPKDAIAAGTRVLRQGERIDIEGLLRWLVERSFHATTAVELPGEFSHRGGILDIYAHDWLRPVRIELFDDEIESLRSFDLGTQRSQETLDEIDVTVLLASGGREPTDGPASSVAQRHREANTSRSPVGGHLTDFLPLESWLLIVDPEKLSDEGKNYLQKVEQPAAFHSVAGVLAECSRFAVATTAELAAGTAGVHCHLPFESVERFSGDIGRIRDELDAIAALDDVYLVTPTEAEVERLQELLSGTRLAASGRLHFALGTLSEGFRLRSASGGVSPLMVSHRR